MYLAGHIFSVCLVVVPDGVFSATKQDSRIQPFNHKLYSVFHRIEGYTYSAKKKATLVVSAAIGPVYSSNAVSIQNWIYQSFYWIRFECTNYQENTK